MKITGTVGTACGQGPRLGRLAGLLMGLLILTGPAAADLRAVLIGVSDYDYEIGLSDLNGPANDMRLMADVLNRRGASRITTLADGVAGAQRPTRAAILEALAVEAREAQPDDFVYIHLSGHGSRQADPDGDETDGQDEVFLPIDTAPGAPGSGLFANAIVDEELGAAIDAIRAKGANVWLVLDSCHSGTGTRMASAGLRYVDPMALGIEIVPSDLSEPSIIQPRGENLPGGYLTFYAAQSTEFALEVNMAPEGAPPEIYGLFTASLAAQIDRAEAPSFRQVYQAVLADLNDTTVWGADKLQTPGWDGNLIDARLFGGGATEGMARFAVRGRQVMAGRVHGLPEGTLMALYADALDPADAIIGHAQIDKPGATSSLLAPVDGACAPQNAVPCPRLGAFPQTARFAQVVARPLDLTIRIAPPRDLATGAPLPADHPVVRRLTDTLASSPGSTFGYAFALDGERYDVEALFDGQALWFGPKAQIGGQAVGLAWTPSAATGFGSLPLPAILERIGQAETFARAIGGLAGQSDQYNPRPVEINGIIRKVKAIDLNQPGQVGDLMAECRNAWISIEGAGPALLDGGEDVKQCDNIEFRAQGLTANLFDVNRVHIDSQYCIHAAYTPIEGAAIPVRLGDPMTICADCPGDRYSAGQERLFTIVTERPSRTEALNLVGRIENCGPGTREATRATDQNTGRANAFLSELADRTHTRGTMMGASAVASIWVTRHDWRVLPRRQALRRAGALR
ncbi:MAG: caspase family protein [Pseudomonadota bacterium]